MKGSQLRYLRSLGHHIKATATLGKQGITETLVVQIQQNLLAHELVKVKLQKKHGPERKELAEEIAQATGALLVQLVGGIVLLYKPHPKRPQIEIPNE